MKNKEMLEKVVAFSQRPALFEEGTGSIWREPYLAKQMLANHINLETDISSRRGEMIEKTVSFIHQETNKKSYILDLGCGPGLYAERLAGLGHAVTGIDFSENSIAYAKESAIKKGLQVRYICDDFFNIQEEAYYDVCLQIYGEVNTFSDALRDKLFKRILEALKPQGKLIFDILNPNTKRRKMRRGWYSANEGFWRRDEHLVLEEVYEYENNIWLEQYIIVDDEDVKVYRDWYQAYTKEEISSLLLNIGFSKVKVIDGLFGEEPDENNEWMTVIAEK